MLLSGNLVSFLTVAFLKISAQIDKVKTRNTTAYFFPLCRYHLTSDGIHHFVFTGVKANGWRDAYITKSV